MYHGSATCRNPTTLTGLMSLRSYELNNSIRQHLCTLRARRQLSHRGKGMQESVHCILFTAATFICRVQDGWPEDGFANLLFPHRVLLSMDTAYKVWSSFGNFPLVKPKYFHMAALRFVGVAMSPNLIQRHLRIMPLGMVVQIITESVMLTIGNLKNLHNRLVYRLTG